MRRILQYENVDTERRQVFTGLVLFNVVAPFAHHEDVSFLYECGELLVSSFTVSKKYDEPGSRAKGKGCSRMNIYDLHGIV
jgi:hypothetical protein